MSGNRKSICFVAPSAASVLFGGLTAGGGGAERQIALLGSTLLEHDWEVSFLTGPGGDPAQVIDKRFVISRAPFHFLSGRPGRLLSDIPAIWRALSLQKSALVGIRTGGPVLLGLLKLWCVMHRAKLVLWVQSDGDVARNAGKKRAESFRRRFARWIYQRQVLSADLLIVQTEGQRAAFAQRSEQACVFIPSLAPARTITTFRGAVPIEPFILWAGNPSSNKRIGLVYELAGRLPSCKFVIAMNPGDASATAKARSDAVKFPNVRFLGAVPPHEMEEWFDRAAIVLNTSVLEGVPNTFLQAWCRGVPVVTAGVDPDGMIVRHGMGCVVTVVDGDTRSVASLASAIRRMMFDPELRAAMGRAGLDYVSTRHSPTGVGHRLDMLLKNLLKDEEEFEKYVQEPVR